MALAHASAHSPNLFAQVKSSDDKPTAAEIQAAEDALDAIYKKGVKASKGA